MVLLSWPGLGSASAFAEDAAPACKAAIDRATTVLSDVKNNIVNSSDSCLAIKAHAAITKDLLTKAKAACPPDYVTELTTMVTQQQAYLDDPNGVCKALHNPPSAHKAGQGKDDHAADDQFADALSKSPQELESISAQTRNQIEAAAQQAREAYSDMPNQVLNFFVSALSNRAMGNLGIAGGYAIAQGGSGAIRAAPCPNGGYRLPTGPTGSGKYSECIGFPPPYPYGRR